MSTHTFTVVIETKADGDHFDQLFAEYMTLPEGPFVEDYGPDAWGGYDGEYVTAVVVYKTIGPLSAGAYGKHLASYKADHDREEEE